MGFFDMFSEGPSSPYYGDAVNALHGLGDITNTQMGLGQQGLNQYNQYNGQALSDFNNLAAYNRNLFYNGPTAAMRNSYLMQNGAGQIGQNYQKAINSAYASNNNRGLGDSSLTNGANAYLAAQKANLYSGLTNQFANWYMQNRPNFLQQSAGIYGNLANQGLNMADNAFGHAAGYYQNLANEYMGLGNRDVENQKTGLEAMTGLMTGIGGLAGLKHWI